MVIFLEKNNIYKFIEKNNNDFIYELLTTEEIKNFWLKNNILNDFKEKLNNKHIIFYNVKNDDVCQKQLNSIFGLIAKREYDNKYIQDLYYLHELYHLVSFNPKFYFTFNQFKNYLSTNELFSSLFSEVFIYYYLPSIREKTFENLWINFVEKNKINKNNNYIQSTDKLNCHNYIYPTDKLNCLKDNFNNNNFNSTTSIFPNNYNVELSKNFIADNNPKKLNNLFLFYFKERIKLRNNNKILELNNLDISEKIIINYNLQREKWLNKYEKNNVYKKIILNNNSISKNVNIYLQYILSNKLENGKFYL